jgi:hypothetical protein
MNGNEAIARALIEKGADVDVKDTEHCLFCDGTDAISGTDSKVMDMGK